MIFDIFDIGKKRSVKDIIVEILSVEWPLSCRKIHWQLRKKYNVSITYQAVHKTLKQMVLENILMEENKKYKINIDWAKKIEEFAKMVSKKYKNDHININSNTIQMTFGNSMEMMEFLIDGIRSGFFGDSSMIYSELIHVPGLFTIDMRTLEKLKKITKKSKFYMLVKNKTILDESFLNLLKNYKINSKICVDCANNFDTYIIGSTVVEVFYENGYKRRLDNFYKSVKSIVSFNMPKFYENIIIKKTKINVFIIRNSELAEKMKEQIKKKF